MSEVLCESPAPLTQPSQNRNQFWYRKLLRKDVLWHDDVPQRPPSPAHLQLQLQQQRRNSQERERNFRQEWWARRQGNTPLTPDAMSPLIPPELFAIPSPGQLPSPAGPLPRPGITTTAVPPSPLLQPPPPTPITPFQEPPSTESLQHLSEELLTKWSLQQAERLQQEKVRLDQELEREAMAKAAHIIKVQMDLQEMIRMRQRLRQTIVPSGSHQQAAVQQGVTNMTSDHEQQQHQRQIPGNNVQQVQHQTLHGTAQHRAPQSYTKPPPQNAGVRTSVTPSDGKPHVAEKMDYRTRAYQQSGTHLSNQQAMILQHNTEQQLALYNNLMQSVSNGSMGEGYQQAQALLKVLLENQRLAQAQKYPQDSGQHFFGSAYPKQLLQYYGSLAPLPYGTPLPQWNRVDKDLSMKDMALLRERQAAMHESPYWNQVKAGTPPPKFSHRHHSYSTPRKRKDYVNKDNANENKAQMKHPSQQHSSTTPKIRHSVPSDNTRSPRQPHGQGTPGSQVSVTTPSGQKPGDSSTTKIRMTSPAKSSTPLSASRPENQQTERKGEYLASPPPPFDKLILTTEKHEIPKDISTDTALEQLPEILEKLKQQSRLESELHSAEDKTEVKEIITEIETEPQVATDDKNSEELPKAETAAESGQNNQEFDSAPNTASNPKQVEPCLSYEPLPQRSPRKKRESAQKNSPEESQQRSTEESQQSLETSASSSAHSPDQGNTSQQADESPAAKPKRKRNRRKKSNKQDDSSSQQAQQQQPQHGQTGQQQHQSSEQQQQQRVENHQQQPHRDQQQRRSQPHQHQQQRQGQPEQDHKPQRKPQDNSQRQLEETKPQNRQQLQDHHQQPAQRQLHPQKQHGQPHSQHAANSRGHRERDFGNTGRRWFTRRYEDWNPHRQPSRYRGYQRTSHYQYPSQRPAYRKGHDRRQTSEKDAQTVVKQRGPALCCHTHKELTELMKNVPPRGERSEKPKIAAKEQNDSEVERNSVQTSLVVSLQGDREEETSDLKENPPAAGDIEKQDVGDHCEQTETRKPVSDDVQQSQESSSNENSETHGTQTTNCEVATDAADEKLTEIQESCCEADVRPSKPAESTAEGVSVSNTEESTTDIHGPSSMQETADELPSSSDNAKREEVTTPPDQESLISSDRPGTQREEDQAPNEHSPNIDALSHNPQDIDLCPVRDGTEQTEENAGGAPAVGPYIVEKSSALDPSSLLTAATSNDEEASAREPLILPAADTCNDKGASVQEPLILSTVGTCNVEESSSPQHGSSDPVSSPVSSRDEFSQVVLIKSDVEFHAGAGDARLLNVMEVTCVIPTPPPSPSKRIGTGTNPSERNAYVKGLPASVALSLPAELPDGVIQKSTIGGETRDPPAAVSQPDVELLTSSLQTLLSEQTSSDVPKDGSTDDPTTWHESSNVRPTTVTTEVQLESADQAQEERTTRDSNLSGEPVPDAGDGEEKTSATSINTAKEEAIETECGVLPNEACSNIEEGTEKRPPEDKQGTSPQLQSVDDAMAELPLIDDNNNSLVFGNRNILASGVQRGISVSDNNSNKKLRREVGGEQGDPTVSVTTLVADEVVSSSVTSQNNTVVGSSPRELSGDENEQVDAAMEENKLK